MPTNRTDQHQIFWGTTWKYTAVATKLTTNSNMKVMTTLWLTASPTPLGPPPARRPLYAATNAAMTPKIRALISPAYRSGTWASAVNDAMYAPGVPPWMITLKK